MKNELRNFYLLVLFSPGWTVIMEGRLGPEIGAEEPSDFNEALGMCLSKKMYGTFECVNRGALSTLQSLNEKDELDFGEMRLERSEGQGRDLLDLDYDPSDFGNVIKAASRLMERRNLRWSLGNLYPGLQMRVGPTLNGNGILEFVLDERVSKFNDRQTGTGRTLMKQVLLPFLLGFKFNLVSLIPLVFGILIFITKKALILTKIALILTGLLGWNSILAGAPRPPPVNFNGFGHGHGYGHDPLGGGHPYQDHHTPYGPFGGDLNPGITPYGHVIREIVNVYGSDSDAARSDQTTRSGKNFVWTRDD